MIKTSTKRKKEIFQMNKTLFNPHNKFKKKNKFIDYKDPTLKEYMTDTLFKIIPKRITNTNASKQRLLAREIKKARCLALLPYTIHKIVKPQ